MTRAPLLLLVCLPCLAQRYTPPRTPDGHPDFQGTWTNATLTPFERPAEFAGKTTLTEAEAAAYERRITTGRNQPPRPGEVGAELFLDSGDHLLSTRQTSLVVDPPDGHVPTTPEAESRRAYNLAHNSDSWEYMSPWDRCITRGHPGAMFPGGSNNAYQIIQTPGYFMIYSEQIHEARIVPTDGRAHVSGAVQEWVGEPVGHWEGDTLVVDSTNYNGKGWTGTSSASGRMKGTPQTPARHVVERFTRTAAGELMYEVTVDDPPMFSKPWKVSMPLMRDDAYRIYEYACHEWQSKPCGLELGAGRAGDRKPKCNIGRILYKRPEAAQLLQGQHIFDLQQNLDRAFDFGDAEHEWRLDAFTEIASASSISAAFRLSTSETPSTTRPIIFRSPSCSTCTTMMHVLWVERNGVGNR